MSVIHVFFLISMELFKSSLDHANFFSDLAQFHAQSMLIFSPNLAQPCLFSILSNLICSKKCWYFSCFKTKINTKHDEKLFLIRKHTSDQFFQHFKVNYAYFQEKSRIVMLIFSRNLALPCLFFFSNLAQPCLVHAYFFLKILAQPCL